MRNSEDRLRSRQVSKWSRRCPHDRCRICLNGEVQDPSLSVWITAVHVTGRAGSSACSQGVGIGDGDQQQ
jgi:hypothetical protein